MAVSQAFHLPKAMHPETTSGCFARSVRGNVLAGLVLISPTACYSCRPEPVEPEPDASTAAILPPAVSVVPGEKFELRVRLKDGDGYVLPDNRAAGTVWEAGDSWLTLDRSDGERAYFVGKVGAPPDHQVVVRAKIGTTVGMATITLADAGALRPDWIVGLHEDERPPMVALVDGKVGGLTVIDSVFAFVREGALDNVSENGRVTVLSRQRRNAMKAMSWTTGCEQVVFQGSAATPPPSPDCPSSARPHQPPLDVKATVFILTARPDASAHANVDSRLSQDAFDDAWAGFRVNTTVAPIADLLASNVMIRADGACPPDGGATDVRRQLVAARVPNVRFASDSVTVAYVDEIYKEGSGASPKGHTCPWQNGIGVIVLVSSTSVPSTLAHELGHAFGLSHADELDVHPRFNPANVMWAAESDLIPSKRSILSLGQSFWMTFAKGTFLEQVGSSVLACQSDINTSFPCPRIRKDFLEP